MFIIGELIRYFEITKQSLFYYLPFVFRSKMTVKDMSDSYFITVFGAKDETNKETLNIQGIYVGIDKFYHPQENLQDCIDNEETFYFDAVNQMLYIHYNHNINPYGQLNEFGKTFGFTNKDVKVYNGIEYDPDIISVPGYQEKTDPIKFSKQAFYGGTVNINNKSTLPNNAGRFDKDDRLYGNDYNILYGEDNDSYEDLIKIAKTYIVNVKLQQTEHN